MNIASFEERGIWIDPWKDRSPMTDDWVLVSLNDHGHKYVTISRYDKLDGWFVDDEIEVVAWMPLPEIAGGLKPYCADKWNEEWTRQ